MDLALLGLECASLYILEVVLKSVVYSVKLKLELAVLGRLVGVVGGSRSGSEDSSCAALHPAVGFVVPSKVRPAGEDGRESSQGAGQSLNDMMDITEFVDLARLRHDVTFASTASTDLRVSPPRLDSRQRTAREEEGYEFARFEHIENVRTLGECCV